MKKILMTVFIGFLTISTTPQSASFEGGYPACISKDLFKQFTSALVDKDKNALNYLNSYCVITKADVPITVLDRTWTGIAKVRAYIGDQTVILWTNTENIVK